MKNDYNSSMNQLESRVTRLEQDSMMPTSGVADISYDAATSLTTVEDQLDWSMARGGWEPYSTISPLVFDQATGEFTGGTLSTEYGRPEAHMVGSMAVLTGVVRRKAGALSLPAGARHDLPMFGLPLTRRTLTNVMLPCLMGNAAPDAATTVGTAWIEIRPGLEPMQPSGIVSYVAGTVACSPGTGWIALQGIFPCHVLDTTTIETDEVT
jgi:hypothetical protein